MFFCNLLFFTSPERSYSPFQLNYLASSSTPVCEACRLWWPLTRRALWVQPDAFKVLPSGPCPPIRSLSLRDKSSVSGPTGLWKLLTVDCLFGFVNVSALEKGWREEKKQGSWRTFVFSIFFTLFWLKMPQRALSLCTYELTCNQATSDFMFT